MPVIIAVPYRQPTCTTPPTSHRDPISLIHHHHYALTPHLAHPPASHHPRHPPQVSPTNAPHRVVARPPRHRRRQLQSRRRPQPVRPPTTGANIQQTHIHPSSGPSPFIFPAHPGTHRPPTRHHHHHQFYAAAHSHLHHSSGTRPPGHNQQSPRPSTALIAPLQSLFTHSHHRPIVNQSTTKPGRPARSLRPGFTLSDVARRLAPPPARCAAAAAWPLAHTRRRQAPRCLARAYFLCYTRPCRRCR